MNYKHPSEIMDEIARLTPTFSNVSYAELERHGSLQWPCNAEAGRDADHAHRSNSCAARGASCSPATCPPRRRSTAAIRCC